MSGRASVFLRSSDYMASAAWPSGSFELVDDALIIRGFGREHIHRPADVCEFRWISLPFPYLVAVTPHDDGECYQYSELQVIRGYRLRRSLLDIGFSFSSQRLVEFWASRRDVRRYGLYRVGVGRETRHEATKTVESTGTSTAR